MDAGMLECLYVLYVNMYVRMYVCIDKTSLRARDRPTSGPRVSSVHFWCSATIIEQKKIKIIIIVHRQILMTKPITPA